MGISRNLGVAAVFCDNASCRRVVNGVVWSSQSLLHEIHAASAKTASVVFWRYEMSSRTVSVTMQCWGADHRELCKHTAPQSGFLAMSLHEHPDRLRQALLRTVGGLPCHSLKIEGELEDRLHNEVIARTIEAMSEIFSHLRELHVQTGFGELVVHAILAALKNNKSLAVLNLLANGCAEECFTYIPPEVLDLLHSFRRLPG